MNIIDLIDSKSSSFSKTEQKIYQGIKKFPERFAFSSISDICNHTGFTKSSLTRFAQKLGFSGYVEFQYQFNNDFQEIKAKTQKRLSDSYSFILKKTEDSVNKEVLISLANLIKRAKCTYVTGASLCRLAAEEFSIATRMISQIPINVPAVDCMPLHYNRDDLLIVYSVIEGGTHAKLCRGLKNNPDTCPHMVLITTNAKHPLRHNFHQVIVLPSINATSIDSSPITDTFAFMMFNELLVNELKK
ncbi:MurR/RpiR family transcriptional regulator [Faecalibacillus intestinalis]|uniref:MurR/RpiR family transcriptional regulator n=1 Tax=Faecalibacillus intestinalis TaxID=1982626 RepID=UPI0035224275